jgi:oligopeptide/dipeptide ABC transporter ATP-binding protein
VTLRAIMGILRSGSVTGRILFEGRDLLTLPGRERRMLSGTALSMVFQDPTTALNPVFTIGDQMGTILKYADRRLGRRRGRRERMARIAEVLGQVRMADPERIARAYPIMLSGGMRQRVLIAMALLNEPRLLIADEPGTALDVTTQAQILALLQDLVRERGLALLMITHNLGVVRESADYVYVMYAGSVVEHGPTRAIFDHPRHPYTRALIDCVPRLSGAASLRGIDGAVPDYTDPPRGCRFQPRCPHARSACGEPVRDRVVGPDHGVACVLADPGAAP